MYLIDTNIFLEVLLDEERREECKKLLEKIEEGELLGIITCFTLHSIAIILERLKSLEDYKKFLEIIEGFKGLAIYSTNPKDEIKICEIAKKFNLSFDDALHYYVAKLFKLELVSFDSDFDGTDLKRIEPKNI